MIPALRQTYWSYRSVGPWHLCREWEAPHAYIQNFTFVTLVDAVYHFSQSEAAPRKLIFDARGETILGLDFRAGSLVRGVGTREVSDLFLQVILPDDESGQLATMSMFDTIRQHCEQIGML